MLTNAQVAAIYKISSRTLNNWKETARSNKSNNHFINFKIFNKINDLDDENEFGNCNLTLDDEISNLREENKRLKMENEFLKK